MPVRFLSVQVGGHFRFARVEDDHVALLDGAPWDGGTPSSERERDRVPLAGSVLGSPVRPRKIFGIGKNYRAHASEMGGEVPGEPLVFGKCTTSILASGGTVLLPAESTRVDFEGELGVVIGSWCRRVPRERAMDHVFGYLPICDVTARDLQAKDGQWIRAKGFDTFCPVGPEIVTGVDPAALELRLEVNGMLRQQASTRDMVFDVATLVSHLSSFATLEPGDLVLTGTPEGVGPLAPGDRVRVCIESMADLVFGVAAAARGPA